MLFEHALLDAVAKGILLSTLGLIWIILLVRVVGLRSFTKMTNFDFVMTVGMGSLLAGAAQSGDWPELLQCITAMAALFTLQLCVSYMRHRSTTFDEIIQNTPVLLMTDGIVFNDALWQTRVTEGDLMTKLREANAVDLTSVRFVVLETTGDVSVLHGSAVDPVVLKGVTKLS